MLLKKRWPLVTLVGHLQKMDDEMITDHKELSQLSDVRVV